MPNFSMMEMLRALGTAAASANPTLVAAPGAGLSIYLVSFRIGSSTAPGVVQFTMTDGGGATIVSNLSSATSYWADQANDDEQYIYKVTANTALNGHNISATQGVVYLVNYYIAP